MAYNSNAQYEPPRRAYYNQQQAPAQNGYGYGKQAQEEHYDYGYGEETYDYGYDQSYEQQYSQSNGYEDQHRARKPSAPQQNGGQYNNGYHDGYHSPREQAPRQHNGFGHEQQRQPQAQPQQRQDRQYDSRYQQRPDRGRQPNYEQRPKQQQSQQYHPEPQQQMLPPKPNPRMGRLYPGQSQQQQHAQPQTVRPQDPDMAPPNRAQFNERPRTAPQPDQARDPNKMTMDEWKAKERARMHAAAMSPEVLAQDNAFPVFPTERARSKARGSGTGSAMGARASGEVARPSTSAGSRQGDRAKHSSRDPTSPTAANHTGGWSQSNHNSYAGESTTDRFASPQQIPSPPQQRAQYQGHDSSLNHQQEQWPMQDQSQSPPVTHSPPAMQTDRRPPPQANGPSYQGRDTTQHSYQDQGYGMQEPQQQQRRPPPPRVQPPPAIDTRPDMQPQKSAYFDHNPISPGQVPQRPSTSQGARSPLKQSMISPISPYAPQSAQQYAELPASIPSKPWDNQHSKQESLGDIYNDYHTDAPLSAPAPLAAPRSRESQIEAEMPDFDSAAPGGTSLLHKRVETSKQHVAELPASTTPAPMQTLPPQNGYAGAGVPSTAAQKQRYYGQREDSYQNSSAPKAQPQAGHMDGFVSELPGEGVLEQQQRYIAPHQQQAQVPQPQRGMPPQPQAPQPPFANEQPRRSMDDARQMAYRDGPQSQQQFRQNGPPQARGAPPAAKQRDFPPNSQLPPAARPHMDRNFSGPPIQPPQYGSMQERVGSAPPTQQHFQQPPPTQMRDGAPPGQHRSLTTDQYGVQGRPANPDALPQHPVPVRPGLMQSNTQPTRPPPVRNTDTQAPPVKQRQASIDDTGRPVTAAELDRLRAAVDASPQNSKQALQYAKKLIEASTVLARNDAKARERYIMDAHKRIKRLSSAGYPDAMFYLGDCYSSGQLGLETDPKEAFKLYQAAAKAGHPEAAYRTAMCCELGAEEGGGTNRDYAKAVQWYRRGAALGDPDAMFKIGIILLKGLLGQPRNTGEAITFLKRAAERSGGENPRALYELASLYESANTNPEVRNKVVADDVYALDLFQQAAKAGHKTAQHRLGLVYEYGQLGVTIDNRQSIMWYSKAAAQGEHQAELALSGWYLTGADGILPHSDTEAYLWARKAAQAEPPLAKALFAMGYFTETGIGCPANLEEAKRWYGRAAAYKFPKAQERLEELRRNGGKGAKPANGKLTRKDQKKDEAECVMM